MNPTSQGNKPTDAYSQNDMDRYLAKISGPLIDRIDIHVEVPAVPYRELSGKERGTHSQTMRDQVAQTRNKQSQRNGGPMRPNSTLTGRELDTLAVLDEPSKQLLEQAMTELGLSARAYDKVRRIARTIADLESTSANGQAIQQHHIAEAIQYRLLDRQG